DAGSSGRSLRSQAHGFKTALNVGPINFQSNQATAGSALLLGTERAASDKVLLFQIHQLAQSDFVRRILLGFDQCLFCAYIVDVGKNQSGFDAGDVESQHSGSMDVEFSAGLHQRVPNFYSVVPGNPNFITQVAGITGAGDVNRNARDAAAGDAKIFQIGDVSLSSRF